MAWRDGGLVSFPPLRRGRIAALKYAVVVITWRAPDDNPVVDPVMLTNHRAITTMLDDAMLCLSVHVRFIERGRVAVFFG